ncbi:MAG: hypothetical protein ACFHWX_17100 [Bacteroidota bacterium]
MYYEAKGVYSAKFPKLAGTYEKEISHYFERNNLENYDCFIDVGAAEGYYAIGVALSNPEIKIVTFESNMINRIWLDHLSIRNNVSNKIKQGEYCSSEVLIKEIKKWNNPFILIDIEGGEYELLESSKIEFFRNCSLLVEIHEFIYPNMAEVIRSRFESSHTVEEIVQRKRSTMDLPLNLNRVQKFLFKKASFEILNEKRPMTMKWIFLKPKHDL